MNELKNRIISLQSGIDKDKKYKREWLVNKVKVFKETFGKNSVQGKQCEEDLLAFDSTRLREETNKYVRFLKENNEKATRKFCKIGKCTSSVDDISQIQKPGGGEFRTDEERAEHVRDFYVNLYKKKIDRIIEIESLFDGREWENIRNNGKRLDENTRDGLEGEVTIAKNH
jgi:hypothetical protein